MPESVTHHPGSFVTYLSGSHLQQFFGGHGHIRLYFQAHGVHYPFNRLIFNLEMKITQQNNPELDRIKSTYF